MNTIIQYILPSFLSAMPAYTSGLFIYLTLDSIQYLPRKLFISLILGTVCGLICGFADAIGDLFIFCIGMLCFFIRKSKGIPVSNQHQAAWIVTIFNIVSLQTTFTSGVLGQSTHIEEFALFSGYAYALAAFVIAFYLKYYHSLRNLAVSLDSKSPFTKSLSIFVFIVFFSQLLMTIINSFLSQYTGGFWLLDCVTILTDVACIYMTVSLTKAENSLLQSQAIIASEKATNVFSAKSKQSREKSEKLLHDYKNIIRSLQTAHATGAADITHELNSAQEQLSAVPSIPFNLDGLKPGLISGLLVNEWLKAYKQDVALSVKMAMPTLDFSHGIQLNLARILGILIDNAIEAVATLQKPVVGVSFYAEPNGDVVINIRNQVSADFQLSNLLKPGFTTKGTGHGHGWKNIMSFANQRRLSVAYPHCGMQH